MSMEKLAELRAQVEEARRQMKDAAQNVVKDGTAEIFENYGDIVHSFGWRQYTPYFNDGDACEFSMHELFVIAHADLETAEHGEESDWLYEGSPAFQEYSYSGDVSRVVGELADERYIEAKQACQSIYDALATNDLAKDVFGDHVKVIFTPEGVDVEDYHHE